MKNNKIMTRKTKVEKRRLAFEKRNVKKEQNRARYGAEGGSALVMAKTTEFNRRVIAAVLALVFVLTTIVVGYNFAAKADDDEFKMYESSDDSGLVLRKGLKDNLDGTYDLKMEAYSTAPIANKDVEANTPLDIVMVMDQSSSMETGNDVWTGNYNETTDNFSVADADDGNHYYKDGDEYYLVQSATHGYAEVQNQDGSLKSDWTGQSVASYNGNLYYGASFTPVSTRNVTKYSAYTNSVDMGANYMNHEYLQNHHFPLTLTNNRQVYVYVPREDGKSCWHAVYYQEDGITLDGYYYTFYYYTNSETGSGAPRITSGNAGDNIGSGDNQITLLCGYRECACAGSRIGIYVEKNGYTKYWYNNSSYNNGSDGNLYVANETGTNNYMAAGSVVLACPEPDSTNSHVYSHPLYTDGVQLYYEKNRSPVYIGNSVFKEADPAYTGTLYTKETITRLEAQKLGATELAGKIATKFAGKDYRIAVVGSADNGTIYSGDPATAANAFVVETTDVTDALTSLTNATANGGSIADGLAQAQAVFAANPLDPADGRKRIVVVFTDDDQVDSSVASSAATLKDTYHASVYSIGYKKDGVSSTVQDWLTHVSSNYFSTAANPTSYTATNDVTYYNGSTDKSSILEAFTNVATAIESPTTKVTLSTQNSVLRDIITKNFIVSGDTTISASVVAVSDFDENGSPIWSSSSQPFTLNDSNRTVTTNDDGTTTIDITGYDYSSNYVSSSRTDDSYGQKFVVIIEGLTLTEKAKTDSDKRIYANVASSGIYKKGYSSADYTEELLMGTFPRPFVDYKTKLAPKGSAGLPDADSGIVVNKYLSTNANGNYDLTVEAYTTKTSTTKTEKIPTDFIVVADQSGSMAYKDMATGYTDAGATYLETIAEDAAKGEDEGYPDGYYYHDASTDNYYRVYPVRSYLYEYIPSETKWTQDIIEDAGMDLSWFQREEEATYSKANQYYYKTSDNVYRPVKVTATGKIGTYYIEFSYKDASGATVDFVRPSKPVYKNVFGSDTSKYGPGSFGYGTVNAAVLAAYPRTTAYTYSEFLGVTTGMYINYPMYKRHVGYTELRYRDVNGVEHTVPASNGNSTWEYCNSSGQAKTTASGSSRPTYTNLYKGSGKITRLQALKNALSEFATAVADEKDDYHNPVDNRIAIVGFSSDGYDNTELLTGTNLTISNKNGKQKSAATTNDYATALVSATSGTAGDVNYKVRDAINALTANGGTQPQDGLEMAYNILQNRDKTTYTTESTSETVDRNVFVIFFTDGHPGDYEYSDMYSAANKVVEKAKLIKDYRVDHSGVTVADEDVVIPSLFSIGVFGESDGNPLTYHAHTDSTNKNYDYLFESGHMDIFNAGWSGYYYLNRNWIAGDPTEYGSTANDTIFDYMSVVSSNYPDATEYMNVVNTGSHPGAADKTGYATYYEMVNGVRNSSTASNTNKFYRMASNQETLVAAFEQAVTRATQSISADQRLDANSVMKDVFKNTNFVTSGDTTYNFASVVGSMDRNGVVNFKEDSKEILYLPYDVETDGNNNTYIDVTGFDYLANYINNKTTNQDGTITDTPHDGKKLVTTITNVVPTGETGDNLESNMPNSAMYIGTHTAGQAFPKPAITSYRYLLDVGDVNKNATFDVTATVWDPSAGDNGAPVDNDSDMLEDVIVVYPNGERHLYSEVGAQTFYGMKNGQKFYFENLPGNYQIKTDVTSTDSAYDYKIYYDYDASAPKPLTKGTPETTKFSYANHTINISSTRKPNAVSIREKTVGTYADTTLEFGETITLEIPIVEGENYASTFTYPCTFNTYHNFSESTIPDGATCQAVFTKVSEANGIITAKLTGFKWTTDSAFGTWTLPDGEFPMQTGDEITITVKGGDTVKVNEVVTHDYGVTYYSGQDDVNPNDIRLKALDGSLLTGNYELTLIPVDGTEGNKKTLTFENGVLKGESNPIDLAPYQSISCAADLSEATLDISGETFNFDYETDGEKVAYVATIRDITVEPPASATVEKNKMDILIVNRMGEIPIESVYDNGHSHIIVYILSGVGILALTAGGYYVWKKKDEFLEQ